jgi:prepilin-type N-terminal cleavage/methylation domain-containing protein
MMNNVKSCKTILTFSKNKVFWKSVMRKMNQVQIKSGIKVESGFSIIELLAAMSVITIMSAVSIFYFTGHKKMRAVDEQAIKFSDILNEARQRAFTQKMVMRVEVNRTRKLIRLISEGRNVGLLPADIANDDVLVKEIPFHGETVIRFDTNPSNIATVPNDSAPVPKAVFAISTHPLSAGQSVTSVRFLRSGLVSNGGTNAAASDATVGGITFHIWKPKDNDANQTELARAITIGGGSGNIRLWNFKFADNTWVDARSIN